MNAKSLGESRSRYALIYRTIAYIFTFTLAHYTRRMFIDGLMMLINSRSLSLSNSAVHSSRMFTRISR